MANSATYSANKGFQQPTMTNSTISREHMISLEGIFADYKRQGYEEATNEYEKQLQEKDKIIEQLKMLLAQNTQTYPPPPTTTIPIRSYNFNSSLFPMPNGNEVIDALVELAQCKREKGKYIINTKTDWYMVWKVLHYFNIYIGSEYDFINIVNDCILPTITDEKRKKILTVTYKSFSNIHSTDSMKATPVEKWRKTLAKQRESADAKTKKHGTLALDRGVNIMTKLQELLQIRNIRLENAEKLI